MVNNWHVTGNHNDHGEAFMTLSWGHCRMTMVVVGFLARLGLFTVHWPSMMVMLGGIIRRVIVGVGVKAHRPEHGPHNRDCGAETPVNRKSTTTVFTLRRNSGESPGEVTVVT
jgi:hypothetical protein